jgi:DNA polymerase III alpha subunit
VAGIVAAGRTIRTRKGERMQFLTIEDEHGLLEATLFPAVWRRAAGRIRSLGPYVFEGKVEEDHDAVSLTVERVLPWDR